MAIKDLHKEIQQLKTELRELRPSRYFESKYKEYAKLLDQVYTLQQKRQQFEDDHYDEYSEHLHTLQNKIQELESIKVAAQKESAIKIPQEIEYWFYTHYCSGTSFGYGSNRNNIKIVYLSPDKKYGIVTNKGSVGWVGIGTFEYHKSSHWVIKINIDIKQSHLTRNNHYGEIEGRLTKEKKQDMLNLIDQLRKEDESKISE